MPDERCAGVGRERPGRPRHFDGLRTEVVSVNVPRKCPARNEEEINTPPSLMD